MNEKDARMRERYIKNRLKRFLSLTGFTLIEIILALAILGIGLVSILSVFVVGANSVRRTVEATEASFIAQMVIEDFKRQGHINTNNITDANKTALPQHYIDSGYSANVLVSDADSGNTGLNCKRVDVSVIKTDRTIPIASFTTYITKYEP